MQAPELSSLTGWLMCVDRAAAAVRAILADYDPDFEAGSLDEAYLDVTDYCRQHGLIGNPLAHQVTHTPTTVTQQPNHSHSTMRHNNVEVQNTAAVGAILKVYEPVLEAGSFDEASLDVTDSCRGVVQSAHADMLTQNQGPILYCPFHARLVRY